MCCCHMSTVGPLLSTVPLSLYPPPTVNPEHIYHPATPIYTPARRLPQRAYVSIGCPVSMGDLSGH